MRREIGERSEKPAGGSDREERPAQHSEYHGDDRTEIPGSLRCLRYRGNETHDPYRGENSTDHQQCHPKRRSPGRFHEQGRNHDQDRHCGHS